MTNGSGGHSYNASNNILDKKGLEEVKRADSEFDEVEKTEMYGNVMDRKGTTLEGIMFKK